MAHKFQPDYHHIEQVLHNQRPERLPLYEHHIDTPCIEKALSKKIGFEGSQANENRI